MCSKPEWPGSCSVCSSFGSPGGGGGQAQNNAGNSIPSVMTPSEAATVLRVSEEDVLASIQSGDLKAKKIGNAYRISKESLDAFLKG